MCAQGAAFAAALFVEIGLVLVAAPRAQAQILTTLYSFCSQSGCTDGQYPYAGLVQGSDGNFYGTTYEGGTNGDGTVFKITPSGTLTTLCSFCSGSGCTEGRFPEAGLVQGSDGNFYGTTYEGGTNAFGTVFKITPSGTLTTLYSFCEDCASGNLPMAGLVQGSDGNFYGTTVFGGEANGGTIFKMTSSGTLATLYSFYEGSPRAGLVQGSDGNFYGTTSSGGNYTAGTVFELVVVFPVAKVSPASLTFDNQDVGTTSLPQTVTLSNTGNWPLIVSGLVTSGDFAQTNDCGGSVAVGGSCTINVTFTPTQTATRTGTLTVTDNSNYFSGSQQTVLLAGTGIGPVGSVDPASLDFGHQVLNAPSAAASVKLSSTGTANLIISSITITGPNAADFAASSPCPGTLQRRASCTINVTFTPSTVAEERATLDVNDNATNSPQTVALSGWGKFRSNPGEGQTISFGRQ
jgi:uncharacterized repeat protein (TIGR03803 family)